MAQVTVSVEIEIGFEIVKPVSAERWSEFKDLLDDNCSADLNEIISYVKYFFENGEVIKKPASGGHGNFKIEIDPD